MKNYKKQEKSVADTDCITEEIYLNGEKVVLPSDKLELQQGGYKGLEQYETNPFLPELMEHIKKGHKTITINGGKNDTTWTNNQNNETLQGTLRHTKQVDKEQFTRYFRDAVADAYKFTANVNMVFHYIHAKMSMNSDMVYIWQEELVNIGNYKSKQQIQRALVFLTKINFIAPTQKPNMWFINPKFFYMGDRFKLIKEYKMLIEEKGGQIKIDLNDYKHIEEYEKKFSEEVLREREVNNEV